MIEKTSTVEQYLASFPKDVRAILQNIRQTIRKVVPAETAEVISYGIPTFKLNGTYVVYYAGFKDHVSIYPVIHNDSALQQEIEPYKAGRGTLHFPLSKPIPYELIEKVAESLLKDNLERTSKS